MRSTEVAFHMLDWLYDKIGATSTVPVVIISVAIMLLAGFLGTRITKLLKLPNVTAYIAVGILIVGFRIAVGIAVDHCHNIFHGDIEFIDR